MSYDGSHRRNRRSSGCGLYDLRHDAFDLLSTNLRDSVAQPRTHDGHCFFFFLILDFLFIFARARCAFF